jgi:predicted Zn-dependent protease with MMP-like domain
MSHARRVMMGVGWAAVALVAIAWLAGAAFAVVAAFGPLWARVLAVAAMGAVAVAVGAYVATRPSRRAAEGGELAEADLSDPELEAIVLDAFDSFPPEFRDRISNLAIVIEDEPPEGKPWLAIYQGVPLPARSVFQAWTPPHKITIYRGPLRRLYGADPERFEHEVRHVVRHEVAHYFGISDERLIEIGRY